jgi:hypothetical protein
MPDCSLIVRRGVLQWGKRRKRGIMRSGDSGEEALGEHVQYICVTRALSVETSSDTRIFSGVLEPFGPTIMRVSVPLSPEESCCQVAGGLEGRSAARVLLPADRCGELAEFDMAVDLTPDNGSLPSSTFIFRNLVVKD